MTVKELIERLSKCNPKANAKIVYEQYVSYSELTSGYETEVNDIGDVVDLETNVRILVDES